MPAAIEMKVLPSASELSFCKRFKGVGQARLEDGVWALHVRFASPEESADVGSRLSGIWQRFVDTVCIVGCYAVFVASDFDAESDLKLRILELLSDDEYASARRGLLYSPSVRMKLAEWLGSLET